MPEIAEVSRIVHFLRLRLVGKKIAEATALDDGNVFGKVGTTGAEVEKALRGRKVVSAGSQGKYFWITLDKPPHLVMHFGMTGWVHIKGEQTAYTNYYKKMKDADKEEWPPKFWKFHLKTEGKSPVEVAFVDSRRFGRVRVIDCPGESIRKHSPLVENGPDPVVDTDIFTESYLHSKMRARRVPIKALLLDQSTISGIGNWVADETLYQAKLHPEQYCDEFSDEQIKKLFEAVRYVCQTAVDKLGDSDQFPEHWLFNYRWDKGKKEAAKALPNGDKLAYLTVGGRTSCYAPDVQKKTGHVPSGLKEEAVDGEEKPKKGGEKARKVPVKDEEEDQVDGEEKPKKGGKRSRKAPVKEEDGEAEQEDESPHFKKRKTEVATKGKTSKTKAKPKVEVEEEVEEKPKANTGRRRSARLQN